MARKFAFSRHPVLWANLAVVLFSYIALVAFARWDGRAITVEDVLFFWPAHLFFALNLVGLFGPGKRS